MQLRSSNPFRVRDFMSANPISVGESTTPRELARVLIDHSISGVPVVDLAAHVVGVVSKTDLLHWCLRGGLGFGASNLLQSLADGGVGTRVDVVDLGIVADFMSDEPLMVSPDDAIPDVAQRMRDHHVHRVIVVDEQHRLLGVVTTFDLLRTLCVLSDTPSRAPSAAAVAPSPAPAAPPPG